MRRYSITLVVVGVLSAWAGGQSRPPSSAHPERVRLLHANAKLVEDLIAHGVKLSGGSTLDQAFECRGAVATLGRALAAAAEGGDRADPSRLIDLSERVVQLVRDGLVPTLEKARAQVRAGSPGAERLKEIEAQSSGELGACLAALPTDGRLGALPQVAEARAKLGELPGALAPPALAK